jgi:thioredoxin reductase (NADPH)
MRALTVAAALLAGLLSGAVAQAQTNTGLLPPDVARDEQGFVLTDANFETASPGVFAVGAVRSGYGGRLTQAAAEATTAAERAAARCDD